MFLCRTKNGSSMASLEEPLEAPLFLRVWTIILGISTVHQMLSPEKILMALFNSLSTAQSCNLSVDGWIACRRKLYLFNSGKLNWSSSRAFCVSKGADLVTITSQTEQASQISYSLE
uniref:C-type lectin domain-containing protein n=1 Tax=Cyprinus carpio TaxID=7962 RepID=A0A8C2AS33_CYPCA